MHQSTHKLIVEDYDKHLQLHYSRNDHHPEHYQMSEDRSMHLTCDLLGTVMGWGMKEGVDLTLAQCRAYVERYNWKTWWRYAVAENLPPRSEEVPDLKPRYEQYRDYRELRKLFDEKYTRLPQLESVQEYVKDCLYQKFGVLKVWQEIVEKYDPRFERISERIQNHDLDLLRPDSIRAYTKYLTRWNTRYPTLHPDSPLGREPLDFGPAEEKPAAEVETETPTAEETEITKPAEETEITKPSDEDGETEVVSVERYEPVRK